MAASSIIAADDGIERAAAWRRMADIRHLAAGSDESCADLTM
jgi:hypothetical protein